MEAWRQCFGRGALKLIAMIHVPALPGSPLGCRPVQDIVAHVEREAAVYARAGVDAVLVENMWDVPYLRPPNIPPHVTAVMTRICQHVRAILPPHVPCGVQVLAGGNKEALAVAAAADLQFVRCEGFVFAHIADEGWTDSCAAELLRYRCQLSAQQLLVFADIKKKHSSHAITADVDVGETAAACEMFLADGVVVTGAGTGRETDVADVAAARAACGLPVLVGSGVTANNVGQFKDAHAVIVGSYLKQNGRWDQALKEDKITKIMSEVHKVR